MKFQANFWTRCGVCYGSCNPPQNSQHDRAVLMADAQGRVGYYDDGGLVDLKDVIRRPCERKERERREA